MAYYKLKHIPTGLYFQPHKHRGSHLSKKGKIYQTATHGLSSAFKRKDGIFRVQAQKDSLIHKQTESVLAWREISWAYNQVGADTLIEDWIIEEI